MNRHFRTITDISRQELLHIIDRSIELKSNKFGAGTPLKNKSVGLFFEKPSTRTRVSFEVAIYQLGGNTVNLNPQEMQIGRGETITDTARVLSRYLDAIIFRVLSHRTIETFAAHSKIPVINGLSDIHHPCQALADMMTIKEFKGGFEGLKIAYIGDGNNVANSLIEASVCGDMQLVIASPEEYAPEPALVSAFKTSTGRDVLITTDPVEAATGADVIYTDVWVSMGQEVDKDRKYEAFKGFQINEKIVSLAKSDAIVLHCLPAYRGLEITDDVIDGPKSRVFAQAENRLHTSKALLEFLLI